MAEAIPPGTRDVLPEEMREIRAIQSALLATFAEAGYLEVRTPTIEYAEVVERAATGEAGAYRFLDDRGDLLALRNDMTVPIARLVSSRMADLPDPWRLCYFANSFRPTTPGRAELREFGQAGIELFGLGGAEGIAEVLSVLDMSLDAVGLDRAVIGLGDAGLWAGVLSDLGSSPGVVGQTSDLLRRGDFVALEAALADDPEMTSEAVESAISIARMRGGREVIEAARSLTSEASAGPLDRIEQALATALDSGAGRTVTVDLGMARDLGYYTGEVLEVYEPSVGRVIGAGGRYDGLMQGFGMDVPAAGFTLYTERVHEARLEAGIDG
jgi:ATP phosphoribosyltransferase regulatory subunit